ncbi:MAG: helix-turn-helix domain-containing protein [Lachnospiraceae bacterium]|nr:helix-turn-helix domain-containing protein [Lachnospiraceae bacterium]
MISNQILQNTIDGLKGITRTDLCVIDVEGKILAATFSDAEQFITPAQAFVGSPADSQVVNGCQFFKVFDDHQLEYILLAYGDSEDVYMIGKIAAFQIQNLLVAYKERFDKDNFIKNLLLDNLLLVDIYNRAKKLHIETDVRRVVFLVETNRKKDGNELEKIRGLFSGKSKDFVTAVDEKNVIVVKELAENETYDDLVKTAEVIVNLFSSDSNCNVHVAYGTIVKELKEVSRSYKEARMALDVGKIFFEDKNIIAYSQLGIGRLIYQLPIPLCKMFIKEIFDGKQLDDFDDELLTTINKFFENSLNVSETSRQLYIHRNTLVYRLDKLQKSTGLDIRVFEDAITFKIALMVVKYMKYMESQDY